MGGVCGQWGVWTGHLKSVQSRCHLRSCLEMPSGGSGGFEEVRDARVWMVAPLGPILPLRKLFLSYELLDMCVSLHAE